MSVEKRLFGTLDECKVVELYRITNASGAYAEVLTYGGTLRSVCVPDKQGRFADVLLGFDSPQEYTGRTGYQGSLVGRYANRIANGRFSIDGQEYIVTKNEKDTTCLHGGGEFSHAIWDAEIAGDNAVVFRYTSPDGAHGFPGEVKVEVRYTFTDAAELILDYRAVSDKRTVLNLTNHAYFNLGGYDAGDVLGHSLTLDADRYTPTDIMSIPFGDCADVAGTPFDFRSPKPIGQDIGIDHEQLKNCGGYDHNFCLNQRAGTAPAVTLAEPISGRRLEVYTDLPGIQLYTGNFLSSLPGKQGVPAHKHAGLCLETQYYPDTPNQPTFPPCTFDAGEPFVSRTRFVFGIQND